MGVSRVHKFSTPFTGEDLIDISHAQTSDRVYLAHIDRPVTSLTRFGHTEWMFNEVVFGPTVLPPQTVSASATSPEQTDWNPESAQYVVTSIDDTLGQESRPSASASATNDLTLEGNTNTVQWSTDNGDRYAVYKANNGLFGYIGATEGNSFEDDNITADLSNTPPRATNPFDAMNRYPSTVAFHQQRLWFARTREVPNGIWASQSADFENMDVSSPTRADDAISQALVGRRVNAVNQLVSSTVLIALTSDSVQTITGTSDDVLTPSSFLPRVQSARGSSRLQPIEVDNLAFFQPNLGSRIRALGFSFQIDGYTSNDVTIFSPHLFERDDIRAWAHQTEPYSCIWAVMTSGKLLCFTWEAEQQVWGWTTCDTRGKFLDVEVITEGRYDRVYFTVEREVNGVTEAYYERMALPHDDFTFEAACHLDCATTRVLEEASKEVIGLWHLEGMEVTAIGDGYAYKNLVVSGGSVTLPHEHSIVTVGIPFTAEIETLPGVLATRNGSLHTERQNISRVDIRLEDTLGAELAINKGAYEDIYDGDLDAPVTELRGQGVYDRRLYPEASWNDGATIKIRQQQPYPLRLLGLFPERVAETGDG